MLKVLGFVGMLGLLFYGMNGAAGLGAFIEINSIVIVFGGAALYWLAVGGIDHTNSQDWTTTGLRLFISAGSAWQLELLGWLVAGPI